MCYSFFWEKSEVLFIIWDISCLYLEELWVIILFIFYKCLKNYID